MENIKDSVEFESSEVIITEVIQFNETVEVVEPNLFQVIILLNKRVMYNPK